MKEQFNGNWLFIKTPDHYGKTDIIEFNGNEIKHFEVEKINDISLVKIAQQNRTEKLTEIEHKFINPNRIRLFRKGIIHKVFGDEKFTNEDCIFEDEYEKLNATETKLTENEIQNLTFEFNWHGEKINVSFNKILDQPFIQEINQRLKIEGSKIVLEKLNDTLFLSFYNSGFSEKLIPIKYVDKQKIVLYGFHKEPYEINCQIFE